MEFGRVPENELASIDFSLPAPGLVCKRRFTGGNI